MGNTNRQLKNVRNLDVRKQAKPRKPAVHNGHRPTTRPMPIASSTTGIVERLSPNFVPSDKSTWPAQILRLYVDRYGRPVTYVTYADWDSDPPIIDFRITDINKRVECYERRLCGVCGLSLDYFITFIGGPIAATNRWYVDPAMHEGCADFSIAVCPHLSRYKAKFSERPFDPSISVVDRVPMAKAEAIVKYVTRDYKIGHSPTGELMVYASPAKQLTVITYPDAPKE